MAKAIKEIIIMLLVCLAGMLLFAVVLYEYIPNRKVVPDVSVYSAPEQIKEMMADDIDKRNEQIIKTFQVTSSDLTNYKITNDYVAGKSDPFASTKQSPDSGSTTKKNANETNSNTSKSVDTDSDTKGDTSETSNKSNESKEKEEVITTK